MYVKNPEEAVSALRRLEVKVDAMRLEFKATGHPRKHSMDEMLSLVEIVRKNLKGVAENG
jgi:plasmid stabilization system protein ParE